MDKNTQNALIVWASTAAGGAGGWWAAARMGASYGLRLGPWGAVAGAVAAAVLSKKLLGEPLGLPASKNDAA
jgi:hypothetical protein